MVNAKTEFLGHVEGLTLVCAEINRGYFEGEKAQYRLSVGYTPEQLTAFLSQLDFEYYDGYGGQELYGTIWYADGTWSDRGEYDGSEWWEHHTRPPVPDYLAES